MQTQTGTLLNIALAMLQLVVGQLIAVIGVKRRSHHINLTELEF